MGEFSLAADAFIASNAYRSVRRSFALGAVSRSESGETDGEQTGLRVSGRYHWQYGDWTLSPMLGLAYENIRVNGYGETGDNSTAMRFGSQKQAVGWSARLGVTWPPAWAAGCRMPAPNGCSACPPVRLRWTRPSRASQASSAPSWPARNAVGGSCAWAAR